MDKNLRPLQKIDVDKYAMLRGTLDEAEALLPPGASVLILPGGGADELIDILTCRKCGRLVCPPHDRNVRRRRSESMIKVPMDEKRFTPFFPERIALELAERLQLVVPGDEHDPE